MKRIYTLLICSIFLLISNLTKAETWDEPWQKEIIKKSDFFVLGKVLESSDSFLKVQILNNLGQNQIENEIIIDDFFMLNIMSSSGQGVQFILDKGELVYLFLKKNNNNNYSLPTPTSGFAIIDDDNNVTATYRHSYHQALIPKNIYELTFKNIWNYYKHNKLDNKQIEDFVYTHLLTKPAGFDESEINHFFLQHAALESAYLLELKPEFTAIEKFANSDNLHSRISALQLLGNVNNAESKSFLFNTLNNEKFSDFEKVIAIWSLKKIGDRLYIKKLKKLKNLSDESGGFGGNIMDPRVGTNFPSPKQAVEQL